MTLEEDLNDMEVTIGDAVFQLDATRFPARLEQARLTLHGCEIVASATVDAQHAPPDAFVLCIQGGAPLVTLPPTPPASTEDHEHRAVFRLGLESIPQPLDCNFVVYALDHAARRCTLLTGSIETTPLLQVRVRNDVDFARLIQTPATRLKDEATLLYAAVHALPRFPNAYAVRAGAICIIGYRLIHRFRCEPEVAEIFDREAAKLLDEPTNLPLGPSMRWVISVRLIVSYVELMHGRLAAAESQFRQIVAWGGQMAAWPSSLTNILLAQYGLGFLALQRGERAAAREMFRGAESLFRFGAGVADFRNIYSYGELGNALAVARECALGQMIAASGGEMITDPNLGPPGTRLLPKTLPAPLGWLLQPG